MKIEIILCTENGYLETQSKLLIYSIRKFGGSFKNIDIYSYNPRKGKPLERSTLAFFEKYSVHYVDIELNSYYPDYPLANKPIVCAHREKISQADILIFLDSDTFFLNSPDFINSVKPDELYMRPVDGKNIGTNFYFSDDNGWYWKQLYDELGVQEYRTVNTTIDDKEILEYYNSGMIISSISQGLFQNWKDNFDKIMMKKLKPTKGLFFVEQSVLSATISAMKLNVKAIPKEFNHPLHLMHKLTNSSYCIDKFSDIGHVHYHKIFNNRKAINPYYKELSEFHSGRVINKKLVEFGVLSKLDDNI